MGCGAQTARVAARRPHRCRGGGGMKAEDKQQQDRWEGAADHDVRRDGQLDAGSDSPARPQHTYTNSSLGFTLLGCRA